MSAKKTVIGLLLFGIIMILTALCFDLAFRRVYTEPTAGTASLKKRQVIIDAGHGGMDGGAVSVTGTLEKDLNLSVAKKAEALFTAAGYEVVMTRDGDYMLSSDASGGSKIRDLKGRLDIANSNPDAAFISIHMNKFPIAKYSGTQVYYGEKNSSGRALAAEIRKYVMEYLQPENEREIKGVGSSIFLLDNIEGKAVLVECGFLSNQAEAEMLENDDYQKKLVLVLLGGFSSSEEQDRRMTE